MGGNKDKNIDQQKQSSPSRVLVYHPMKNQSARGGRGSEYRLPRVHSSRVRWPGSPRGSFFRSALLGLYLGVSSLTFFSRSVEAERMLLGGVLLRTKLKGVSISLLKSDSELSVFFLCVLKAILLNEERGSPQNPMCAMMPRLVKMFPSGGCRLGEGLRVKRGSLRFLWVLAGVRGEWSEKRMRLGMIQALGGEASSGEAWMWRRKRWVLPSVSLLAMQEIIVINHPNLIIPQYPVQTIFPSLPSFPLMPTFKSFPNISPIPSIIQIISYTMSNEQNLIAMNMKYGTESVQYFYKQGKLTQEQFNQVSGVIKSLFKIINDSQKNYNSLNETMRILKKDLTAIKHEYEAANNRQAEVTEETEKLSRALKTAEVAYESQKASYENLLFQADELDKEVANMDQKMRDDFRTAEEKIQPRLEKYNLDIQENKAMNEKTRNSIENLQRILEENMQKIQAIKKENSELAEQEQKLKEVRLKIKDSPDHYAKSAQNLNIEIIGMQAELKDLREEIDRKEKICVTFKEKMEQQKEQIEQLRGEREESFQNTEEIGTAIESIRNMINSKESDRGQLKVDVMNQEAGIEELSRNIKSQAQRINNTRKQTQKVKREYKKQEVLRGQQQEIIKETEMIIQKIRKEFSIITSEMREQKAKEEQIKQDTVIVVDRTATIKDKTANNQSKKKEIEAEIKKMEGNLTDLKRMVNNIQKEIKDSTGVRESMARKASTATAEVRETRQELKVKELLILDLTKKYEQTGNKLEHFKALYEQVKSARNKYVNLIQNSSQDLAQLKERIKILQNQLQILKNESAQKNKTIQDYNHMLQLQVHKRDQTKAKLNKYDLQKKEKKELVDQNTNEIEKLNMIIVSLQRDMQGLRQQYEQACENRNITGIQLIDRNDQLCILYEKSNIQENILRTTEMNIKNVEDEIRMIRIEIAQNERKVKVAQERLVDVPKLAETVLDLQRQIQGVHLQENDLSRQLQDPENKKRWRELEGEDPDEQALDAKISIIEQRLNSKKEQLLEKELILDEVSNLVEKLKRDATQGRQSTLEVSEKINEFQSRLRDLTRKMKATISELSMCQANIIKYQNQREQLQGSLQAARKRMQQGLPPTPQTEIEYLKMIRDKKRYEEQRNIRMQKEMMEQNYPPFATKTTANQRVNSYIPDQIGLPKPYGNNAPFMYQAPGANMRHFKKPKVKEIEI